MALYFFEFKHRADRDAFVTDHPEIEFTTFEGRNINFFARTTDGETLLRNWKGKPINAWKEI